MATEIPALRSWWLSTSRMTVFADCENDIIYDCSDIIQKFKGQHIKNLANWLRLQGGFKFSEMKPPVKRNWRDKVSV